MKNKMMEKYTESIMTKKEDLIQTMEDEISNFN